MFVCAQVNTFDLLYRKSKQIILTHYKSCDSVQNINNIVQHYKQDTFGWLELISLHLFVLPSSVSSYVVHMVTVMTSSEVHADFLSSVLLLGLILKQTYNLMAQLFQIAVL